MHCVGVIVSVQIVTCTAHQCSSACKELLGERHPKEWQQVGTLHFTEIILILFKDSLC